MTKERVEKTYTASQAEQTAQDLWQTNATYSFDARGRAPLFSIDTPPPTVSGSLHIGHVFSYTHTDIIARYKRLRGFRVFYPMGFDDNGLPTERFVEKKHKTKAHIVGRSPFIRLCQDEVKHAHTLFSGLWKRLGLSVDWEYTYSTISDESRRLAQKNFLTLLQKGEAYRTATPALFCTTCQTSVAQAELESEERATTFNTILFKDSNGTTYPIATTRPELLPGCVAVFYHPNDTRYTHLHGTMLYSPHYHEPVPCLPDEAVEPTKGTGLVMCCTFGDQTDIAWYKKHKLPIKLCMTTYGKWAEQTGPLAGQTAEQARKTILSLLATEGSLTEQKNITHAVAVHERCKQPIEYLVVPQWYIRVNEHKKALLELGQQVTWIPGYMHSRYVDWVQNLAWDWCISRQRFYGVPFPVWHCTGCAYVVTAPEGMLPVDPTESSAPIATCPSCNGNIFVGETDVMDTWNISSLTPQLNHQSEPAVTMPMSLRPQAHDIIRTWAFYTILKSYFDTGSIPWHTIAISGHVTQGSGKISKSTGGSALTPEHLLATYSADAIRYWTAKGAPGVDTAFSEEQLKNGGRLVTKLWNAFRFITEHVTEKPAPTAEYDAINSWLWNKLLIMQTSYESEMELYNYARALEQVEQFFWRDFCDNYLELVKDRLFNPALYTTAEVTNTKATLYAAGYQLLKLYAPFIPHATETIYQAIYRAHEHTPSLHTANTAPEQWAQCTGAVRLAVESLSAAIAHTEQLLTLVGHVRKLKSELQCSLKTEISCLTIHTIDASLQSFLTTQDATIRGITRARSINFSATMIEKNRGELSGEQMTAHVGIE